VTVTAEYGDMARAKPAAPPINHPLERNPMIISRPAGFTQSNLISPLSIRLMFSTG
jgi:hypothetical protein